MTAPLLTEVIIDAARVTASIYKASALKLAARGHESALDELERVAVMEALAADVHLCEMLAGRIDQISHGVRK